MNGHKLKKMRIEKGYSLSKFSKLTGISKSYLSLIERGVQKNPSLEILEKISETFGVEVKDLVEKKKDDKQQFVKSTLKVEIELSEDQLRQIKELILKSEY